MQEGERSVQEVQGEEQSKEVVETNDEAPEDETAEEAYDRIVNGKATEEDGNAHEEIKEDEPDSSAPDKPELKDDKPSPDDEFDADLVAPDRLDARGKRMFANLPKHLRREYHRAIRDLQSGNNSLLTQERQALQREKAEISSLKDAVTPYAEHFGSIGMTVPQAVSQLLSVHKRLTDPDPSKREAELLKIASQSKIDLIRLANRQAGGGVQNGAPIDISNHPQYLELQSQIKNLSNSINPVLSNYQQQISATEQKEVEEMRKEYLALVNEYQPNGGLRYDKLVTDAEFREQRWKPLVSAILSNAPTLPVKEAYRQAYQLLVGNVGETQSLNQTRPPNRNNATQAAPSVRGRTSVGSMSKPTLEPPTGLSADAEYEWFMNQR